MPVDVEKELEKMDKQLNDMLMEYYDKGINDCRNLIIKCFKAAKKKGDVLLSIDQIVDIIENTKRI